MCFGNILGSISGRGLILGIRSGIWGGFRDSALRKLSDKQLINAVLIHIHHFELVAAERELSSECGGEGT